MDQQIVMTHGVRNLRNVKKRRARRRGCGGELRAPSLTSKDFLDWRTEAVIANEIEVTRSNLLIMIIDKKCRHGAGNTLGNAAQPRVAGRAWPI